VAFESFFLQAFMYLSAALVAVLVGKRLGMGAVLGYLIAGALIGPSCLKWVGQESEQITHFAEFGVVMMLFLVGLELQPSHLWSMRKQIFGLGALQVAGSTLVVCALAMAFGMAWQPALAIGLILAMSSTAIVLQSLNERDLLKTEAGQNSFAVLLFQDLSVIPIMALLPLLAMKQGAAAHGDGHGAGGVAWMEALPPWTRPLVTVGAVVVIVLVARVAVRPFFRAIAQTRQREAFTAASLLLIIAVALLMTKVGLSAALGTFVAGVVLANSEYRHELESDIEPFKGLLLGLFFLGVGTAIDFGHIARNPGTVFGAAAGLLLLKGGVIFALARWRGASRGPSLIFASALAAGGEFAFVLIALSRGTGVFSEEISRTLIAVVALTMAATPLLIMASHRYTARCLNEPEKEEERESDVRDEGAPVIICGFGRFGHAVGRLLHTQGIASTVLDNDPEQVETLRVIGFPVFYGDAGRPDLLLTAGAARAKVLVIALRDPELSLEIVKTARKHFPQLKIFMRAHSRREAYEFIEAGEECVYRETLDSSLRMGTDVMRMLGMPAYAAHRAAKLYRKADETFVRKMVAHRHNRATFLNAAREAQVIFAEVMRVDPLQSESGDDAWIPPARGDEKEDIVP
jgi:monovalent cation:H+ antiporter-2, CPA2 family